MAKPHQDEGLLAAVSAADGGSHPNASDMTSILENLYRTHWSGLTRYIASRFGAGPPEPEEVAQAAFAKLAASPDIGALTNPRGYLYTIACNIVIDHHRRSSHHDAVHHDLSDQAATDGLSDFSPENVLLAKERFVVFETALKAMPKMRRRIFLLVRAEGLPPREVARQFGMTEGAVHKHVSRALQDCLTAFEKADKHAWNGK
jgi:RNA polymerase sigma-70 factor (ECF subfamily)